MYMKGYNLTGRACAKYTEQDAVVGFCGDGDELSS